MINLVDYLIFTYFVYSYIQLINCTFDYQYWLSINQFEDDR